MKKGLVLMLVLLLTMLQRWAVGQQEKAPAATMLVIFPLLLAFLIFQKQFIQSFLHSGIK